MSWLINSEFLITVGICTYIWDCYYSGFSDFTVFFFFLLSVTVIPHNSPAPNKILPRIPVYKSGKHNNP